MAHTNMKSVGEILNRPEIAELNPVKFYIVRAKPSATGAPDTHDFVQTGRMQVRQLSSAEERHSTAPKSPFSDLNVPARIPDDPAAVIANQTPESIPASPAAAAR